MPEVKLTLTDKQLTKAKKAVRKRAGADNEQTDGQLLKAFVKNQIAGIVEYDAKQEASSKIEPF